MRFVSLSTQQQILALVLLSFVTFFAGLGRPAITDADEGFYAESAREMVESGDWLTPHFNYEDRWQKPVLYYWLAASTFLVTGPDEWGARGWAALSGLGLALLTWRTARRLIDQPNAALIAGAIVSTCYGYFAMARLALPDLPLAFFMTATILAALEQRWWSAGIAAGLGFLTKGPVAFVIPAIVLVPIWWREASWPPIKDLALGGAIALIVGLPWYVAMTLVHGTAYLQSFFVGDNLERFATARFNGPRFVFYYVPIVIGGLVPWALYLLVLPWRRGIAVLRRRDRLTSSEWQLLIWCFAPLLFFTASVGKQPRYILPVLPPLAILLAQSIAKRLPGGRHQTRGLALATGLTAVMLVVLAGLLLRARPLIVSAYPLLMVAGVAAITLLAILLAWIAARSAWRGLPAVLAVSGVALLLSFQFGALSGIRPEPVEQMAALISERRTTEPIGVYQVFVRNLGFYTGLRSTELFSEADAVEFLKSPDRNLLVVRARDLSRLESLAGVAAQPLAQVTYLDPANVRLGTLIAPNVAEDLDTVLLVANR